MLQDADLIVSRSGLEYEISTVLKDIVCVCTLESQVRFVSALRAWTATDRNDFFGFNACDML